jgi:hypothetical protein
MPYTRVFSTLGCPDLTLEAAATLARAQGVAAIELRTLAGTMDLPAYLAATYGTPEKLAARWVTAGVAIAGLGTTLKVAGGTAADRAAFLQFIPWAEALGVPWLRVFDGGKHADAAELAEAAATVRWWRELRAKNAWKTDIAVETHDSLLTGAAVRRFLAAAPGTAIRWDTHHTWKKGGEDPVATWGAIKEAVRSLDVKDSVGRPSAKHAWTYVLPGDGEFPMAPLREILRAEYTGPMCLEWEKLWHPELPPLAEALGAARQRGWW